MTVQELQQHLLSHQLYMIQRELTHTGNPKKVSFVVVREECLYIVDSTAQFLLQEDGATLSPHGSSKVVHLFNRWTHTPEEWVSLLSQKLYGDANKIRHVVV